MTSDRSPTADQIRLARAHLAAIDPALAAIEAVTADGGRALVVVDYKTSRRPSTVDELRTSLPMAMYAVAVAGMFKRPCVDVELHHVPTGTVARHRHTAESLDRKVGEVESIAVVTSVSRLAFTGSAGAVWPAMRRR